MVTFQFKLLQGENLSEADKNFCALSVRFSSTVQNNNQAFTTKTLRKAIMKRSILRNKFNKERNIENWSEYKRQRNLCLNLLRKSKKRHFNNLNVKKVTKISSFGKL